MVEKNRYYTFKEKSIRIYATPPTPFYLQEKFKKLLIFEVQSSNKANFFSKLLFVFTTKLLRELEFLLHVAYVQR